MRRYLIVIVPVSLVIFLAGFLIGVSTEKHNDYYHVFTEFTFSVWSKESISPNSDICLYKARANFMEIEFTIPCEDTLWQGSIIKIMKIGL